MAPEIPDWVVKVVWWTQQNDYLASIFERAGKNHEKALELLKKEHGERAMEIMAKVDLDNEQKNHG